MRIRYLCLSAALCVPPLAAQTVAPSAAAPGAGAVTAPVSSPATGVPQARAGATTYQSVFADYRPWNEPTPIDWRAANREAGALGGHMGHLRGKASGMAHDAMPAPAQVPRTGATAGPAK